MVDAALIDLGTLGVIFWLLRRDGGTCRGLLGPPTTAWQVGLGALAVLAASVQRAGGDVGSRACRAGRLPGCGAATAGGAPGPALAGRHHRGGRLGWRARLLPAADRRLLPIMAARWVVNGTTALALALGLVG
jgi:hypothetical protein